MQRKGFTLLEILIATLVMALVMTGLTYVFLAAKGHLAHTRSRIQAAELGRLFIAPLQMQVKQSDWNSSSNDYNSPNLLQKGTRTGSTETLGGIIYTPTYEISVPPGFSSDSPMRKAKVTIAWNETIP